MCVFLGYMPEKQIVSLVGADLKGQDLRDKDFTGYVLNGTDLRGAQLYGASISLTCDTFDGVLLDDEQVATFLLMLRLSGSNLKWKSAIYNAVESVVGAPKARAITRLLKVV